MALTSRDAGEIAARRDGRQNPSAHPKRSRRRRRHRIVAILDELQLTEFVTSITGISAVGAAAIQVETGDPTRFAIARATVKRAGLAPRVKFVGH
ncbi:MAG: transposase [Nocardioidaceae bacterium]